MTGRCLCGAVSFAADEVETDHHACHCSMCRRWSSSAFLGVHCAKVTFRGESLRRYVSSDWAERGFCATCGSTLFYFLKPTGEYTMSVGAFDDQTTFRLTREIFIDHKPPGHTYAGEHERWTEAETFERLTPK